MKKFFLIILLLIHLPQAFGQITVIPKTEPDSTKNVQKIAEKIAEKENVTTLETAKGSILSPAPIAKILGKIKLTATIENRNSDYIYIKIGKNNTKKIKINEAGFFCDSINANSGFYQLYDGVNFADLYLKDGYNMIINVDAQNFIKSLAFSGDGAAENNFMATSRIIQSRIDLQKLMNLKFSEFELEINKIKKNTITRLSAGNFEEFFLNIQLQKADEFIKDITNFYKKAHEKEKQIKATNFEYQYPDYNGKLTSTKDFYGSYIFIQVWSIDSGASAFEAPYLREIIRKYSPLGFSFISICIDTVNGAEVQKWKEYIDKNGLTGTHLLADAGWNSKIITDFNITALPRYILLDPAGKLMQPNAPRPSSPNLRAGFDQLLNGEITGDE